MNSPLQNNSPRNKCLRLVEAKLNTIAKEIVSAMLSLGAYRREPRARANFTDDGAEFEDDGAAYAVSVLQNSVFPILL